MIECKNFVRLRILYKSLDQSWLVGLWFKLSVDSEYIYIFCKWGNCDSICKGERSLSAAINDVYV